MGYLDAIVSKQWHSGKRPVEGSQSAAASARHYAQSTVSWLADCPANAFVSDFGDSNQIVHMGLMRTMQTVKGGVRAFPVISSGARWQNSSIK
jgi:hypothetical protein